MTRKKFIKKQMAAGMSRNQAREAAAVVPAEGLSYEEGMMFTSLAMLFKSAGLDIGFYMDQLDDNDPEKAVAIFRKIATTPWHRQIIEISQAIAADFQAAQTAEPAPAVKWAEGAKKKPDGLRTDFCFVDEWHLDPAYAQNLLNVTTAKPDITVVSVDRSNGTDYTVELTSTRDKDGALHVRAMKLIPPEEATT